uniref:Uncharacterized protein n=1 Tax=Macaca nemestrina TaxID=9545 RepID=A0A2K6B5K3_MACNE
TYLTHDSPFMRKTYCSEQAQSLTDKTRVAFQQGKIFPTSISVPPPAGTMIPPPSSLLGPPHPGMMPAAHTGPPPRMMPVGPAPGMRLPMGSHMPMMPGPPMMRPLACPMMVPTWPRMTRADRKDRGEASLYQFYITCSTSPGDYNAVTLGVFFTG